MDEQPSLRIWTERHWEYPASELDEAESLLRHLESVSRGSVAGGVDVLATDIMIGTWEEAGRLAKEIIAWLS